MVNRNTTIGITAGDPAGIGPEISLKAVNELNIPRAICIVIGRHEILKKHYPGLINKFEILEEAPSISLTPGKKYFLDIPSDLPVPVPGAGNIDTGRESKDYIDKAVSLFKAGIINAVVTGPVNKGFIEKSGTSFSGHTEYIASLLNEKNPYMLMYSKCYRVLLVTTHVPVFNLQDLINQEKIYNTIAAGHRAMTRIDGKKPKIAIAGLDPHCGDQGAIGNFDMDITSSAVKRARSEGIDIDGPFAADTLFMPEKWKSYNLIIAHYHDQGLIPFKTLAFASGINITLGLSIIRTSPDHGTAFDIAGREIAAHKSMSEAIKIAYRLANIKRD